MLLSGVLKFGRSISASNRPAIQNMWTWVKSARRHNDFELQFLRFVGHPLWQSVQMQIEIAHDQDGDDQENTHHHHQNVRFTGRRNETRQMVGSQRIKLIAQKFLHISIQHSA